VHSHTRLTARALHTITAFRRAHSTRRVWTLLVAVAAVLVSLFGAGTASAAPLGSTYDTAANTYDAPAPLSAPLVTTVVAPRPLAGPGVASWVSHVSFGRSGVAANTSTTGTNFIVGPNGETIVVPDGAVGPSPVTNGKGFQFTGGSGGHGLDPSVTSVRIMDPATTGPYTYPNGYVSYLNGAVPRPQTVNPFTGQTVGKADPWWHWSNQP